MHPQPRGLSRAVSSGLPAGHRARTNLRGSESKPGLTYDISSPQLGFLPLPHFVDRVVVFVPPDSGWEGLG